MNSFWDNYLFGNSTRDWITAIAIIVGSVILLHIIKTIVIAQLKKLSVKTHTTIDDFLVQSIERSVLPFFYLLSIYFGLSYLSFGENTEKILRIAILVASTFFTIRIITSFINYAVNKAARSHHGAGEKSTQARGIVVIVNIIVWIIGIVFLVDNLGYDITTLVAGLGIGGIAIALAAQTVLGDLFSYFVIFFDKPFEIGDFIIIGDKMGTVEYVGIKTTRIRALSGEQLIVSNTDLTNSRVQNFKRMETRRVVFSISIAYETSAEKLKKIPSMIKKIIEEQPELKFDRAHFLSLADSSLKFEVVYFVASADYNLYMDRQQQINLSIFEQFENDGIEFAYPTQKIYVAATDNFENNNSEQRKRHVVN